MQKLAHIVQNNGRSLEQKVEWLDAGVSHI